MFSDPTFNVEQLDLQSGSKVADFGSGSGFYTFALAKAVGDMGRVFAIEVQKDLLQNVKNESLKRGLSNIDFIWGDIEKDGGSHIRDELLDAVVVANVFFQVIHKRELVGEIKRILKRGGQVLVVDWTDSFGGLGPTSDSVISEQEINKLFIESGFTKKKNISAGEHHFGIIFKK